MFDVIEGGKDKPKVKKKKVHVRQHVCKVCSDKHGVATSCIVPVLMSPMTNRKGELIGGTEVFCCAFCLARGILTVFEGIK